jgi:hypothetical protein
MWYPGKKKPDAAAGAVATVEDDQGAAERAEFARIEQKCGAEWAAKAVKEGWSAAVAIENYLDQVQKDRSVEQQKQKEEMDKLNARIEFAKKNGLLGEDKGALPGFGESPKTRMNAFYQLTGKPGLALAAYSLANGIAKVRGLAGYTPEDPRLSLEAFAGIPGVKAAAGMMTLLDIAKHNQSNLVVGLLTDIVVEHPEWDEGFAQSIAGTQYKAFVRVAYPAAGFRKANEGIEPSTSAYEDRLVECAIVDASWDVDEAVATADVQGTAAICAMQAGDHMEAAIINLCQQFYYGKLSSAPNAAVGFPGLRQFINSALVIDAGGSSKTGSCTSIWAVKWDIKHAGWVFGNNGRFTEGEILRQRINRKNADGSYGLLWALCQSLQGWIGFQRGGKFSAGCIKNIDSSEASLDALSPDKTFGVAGATDYTANDSLLGKLLRKFPKGERPSHLYMTRNSREAIRLHRTAVTPTGAEAAQPDNFLGIPFSTTDSISDTEASW